MTRHILTDGDQPGVTLTLTMSESRWETIVDSLHSNIRYELADFIAGALKGEHGIEV